MKEVLDRLNAETKYGNDWEKIAEAFDEAGYLGPSGKRDSTPDDSAGEPVPQPQEPDAADENPLTAACCGVPEDLTPETVTDSGIPREWLDRINALVRVTANAAVMDYHRMQDEIYEARFKALEEEIQRLRAEVEALKVEREHLTSHRTEHPFAPPVELFTTIPHDLYTQLERDARDRGISPADRAAAVIADHYGRLGSSKE